LPDTITGSNGAIKLTNANILLTGPNDAIMAGSGDTITLTNWAGFTIKGTGDVAVRGA
jgi:hypothetical protein